MRLASMNIWATHGDWRTRRRLLIDTFDALDPDLFRLQETIARDDYDQVGDVLAGDLDADPDSTSIRFWTGRHPLHGLSVCYRDAWEATHPGRPGHTYTPDNQLMVDEDWPFGRVDDVLVRCAEHGGPALRIRDCRMIGHDPPASDHHGVLTDLEAT